MLETFSVYLHCDPADWLEGPPPACGVGVFHLSAFSGTLYCVLGVKLYPLLTLVV